MRAGELAALAAAVIWAIASLIYARVGARIPALWLNALKGGVAIALLLLTLLLQRQGLAIPLPGLGVLLLSGLWGIGLGDSCYFQALRAIGARRTLLLEMLCPVLATLAAWPLLGEQLGLSDLAAIGVILAGVAWVVSEQTETEPLHQLGPGVLWALGAVIGQVGGVLLSRLALTRTGVDPLPSSLVRLLSAQVALLVLLRVQATPWPLGGMGTGERNRLLGVVAVTSFLGAYLGIWLQQTSLRLTPAGVSQALTSTSPVFVLLLSALAGRQVSLRAWLGTAIALGGVAWLLL
jgi:drug/metabolite transporter (DMT)-like permease